MVWSDQEIVDFYPEDDASALRAFLKRAKSLDDCRRRAEYVARQMQLAAAAHGLRLRVVSLEASWRSF